MQRPEQNLTQIASEPQQPDLNNCLCRSVKREEVEETLLGNQQTREDTDLPRYYYTRQKLTLCS
ncbi:TPA: hypothetical protein ACH3X1_013385 [Trebouxia sp. C0004]